MSNWIPVTERLPEKDVEVLCCDEDGNQYVAYYTPGYTIYITEEDAKTWHDQEAAKHVLKNGRKIRASWTAGQGVGCYESWCNYPLAWQPLSKPYKAK